MRREERLMPGTRDSMQIGHRNEILSLSLSLSLSLFRVLKAYKLQEEGLLNPDS